MTRTLHDSPRHRCHSDVGLSGLGTTVVGVLLFVIEPARAAVNDRVTNRGCKGSADDLRNVGQETHHEQKIGRD